MRNLMIAAATLGIAAAGGALAQQPQTPSYFPNPPGWEPFAKTYDGNLPVLLKGKITGGDWSGLRASVFMDQLEAGKAPVAWKVDLGATSTALERGFRPDDLKPGVEIIVRGYQAKDRSNTAAARDITFDTGRVLFNGSSSGAPRNLPPPG